MEHFFKIVDKRDGESIYDSRTPYHTEAIALEQGEELRRELRVSSVNYKVIAEPAMQEA